MPERHSSDFRPVPESSRGFGGVLLVLAILAGAAGFAWWYWLRQPPVPADVSPPSASVPDQPAAETPPPASEQAIGPQHPIDAVAPPEGALPRLNDADARVTAALGELLGGAKSLSFLQLDGFVRRVVATVDNLVRPQAAARMWPVQPAPGRFTVAGAAGGPQTIDVANAARHGAFVAFVETIDVGRAAALYARLYPLFQEAYEELGYPGRYFNDRLIAVIDHLLQAPEPEGPVAVTLVEVKGEYATPRPWTRYEFVDPELESLSSGQKLLVRMGVANERRLKARLAAFRERIAAGAVATRR
ncbi:DUF3014 domain-containing protein [Comamonadaceae bacterium OTU4NAUVB1]|nr:DUF3014 domain-containing protein [Comamonadaceae bacterium OTU4NAUVB1]HSU22833.1 DUF3014 domain-containing protein [Variovorax sp.]